MESVTNVTQLPSSAGAKARQLRRNRSVGAVMVEYAFLLVAFCVPVAAGTVAAGVKLITNYGAIRNNLLHKGP
jgi:Flp pilus assembly pilin Flp